MRLLHYSDRLLPIPIEFRGQESGSFLGLVKPNGLWVSVEGDDDWKTWCEDQEWGLERLSHVHEIELDPAAKVLSITSTAQLDAFVAKYGEPIGLMPGGLDWASVADRYQGVIIAPHNLTRRTHPSFFWYWGWDCASGCIWDPAAIASVRMVDKVIA